MELILLRDFEHKSVTVPKTSKSMKKGDCVSVSAIGQCSNSLYRVPETRFPFSFCSSKLTLVLTRFAFRLIAILANQTRPCTSD